MASPSRRLHDCSERGVRVRNNCIRARSSQPRICGKATSRIASATPTPVCGELSVVESCLLPDRCIVVHRLWRKHKKRWQNLLHGRVFLRLDQSYHVYYLFRRITFVGELMNSSSATSADLYVWLPRRRHNYPPGSAVLQAAVAVAAFSCPQRVNVS